MDIKSFISRLLPTFGRDRILEDFRITKQDISSLIPIYAEAAKLFKNYSPKHEFVKDKYASFKSSVKIRGSDNMVVFIDENLPKVLANIEACEKLVQTALNNNIAGSGLTIKQATIVKYADLLYFISKYSRKLLNAVYVFETSTFENLTSLNSSESIPKAELDWLNNNFLNFCYAFSAATGEPSEVIAKVESIPDIEASKANHSVLESTLGAHKLDPLKIGFIGQTYNPILFVRLIVAEWQVRRYKAAKEELAALQLRQLQLTKLLKGQADAKIENQIAYLESRIQKLNYEIAEMEKS